MKAWKWAAGLAVPLIAGVTGVALLGTMILGMGLGAGSTMNTTTVAARNPCANQTVSMPTVSVNPQILAELENNASEARIVQDLMGQGGLNMNGLSFTPMMIAGILGNWMVESAGTFNPAITGAGDHHGLAQWGGNRWNNVLQLGDPPTIQTEVQYALNELAGGYRKAYEALQSAQTVETAVLAIAAYYEICPNGNGNDPTNPADWQDGGKRVADGQAVYQLLSTGSSNHVGNGTETTAWHPTTASNTETAQYSPIETLAGNPILQPARTIADTTGGNIITALEWATQTADNQSIGYVYGAGGPQNYDCSHFVYSALKAGGYNVHYEPAGSGAFAHMLENIGWTPVTAWNKNTGQGLTPGDVLIRTTGGGHIEMYYGDGQTIGAHTNSLPQAQQVSVMPWSFNAGYEGGFTQAYQPPEGDGAQWNPSDPQTTSMDACQANDSNPGGGMTPSVVSGEAPSTATAGGDYGWMSPGIANGWPGFIDQADYYANGYQCVWYAWNRLYMLHKASYGRWTYQTGNGGTYQESLKNKPGWVLTKTPQAGDALSLYWNPLYFKSRWPDAGHIAVVEAVQPSSDGGWQILISEGNGDGKADWNGYNERTVTANQLEYETGGRYEFFYNTAWNQ